MFNPRINFNLENIKNFCANLKVHIYLHYQEKEKNNNNNNKFYLVSESNTKPNKS